jgi:hypothetical protein
MSGAVILHWDLPVALQAPQVQKKCFVRWSHTCKAFGVTDICLIDCDALNPWFGDAEVNLSVVGTLDEALALYQDKTPVFVEQGGVPLPLFTHPDDPVYVFGSDYGQLDRSDVEIASDRPLHAETACGIVLADWGMNRWR